MSKFTDKIEEQGQEQASRYGFNTFSLKRQGNDHYTAYCDDIIVRGVPATTTTLAKHVAQNALKRARTARKLGWAQISYRGGK